MNDGSELALPVGVDLSRRPEPTQTKMSGSLGGPSFERRGATTDCMPGGFVCRLKLPGCPLDGHTFGAPGTIGYLVDLWLDHQRLPPWIKAATPRP